MEHITETFFVSTLLFLKSLHFAPSDLTLEQLL